MRPLTRRPRALDALLPSLLSSDCGVIRPRPRPRPQETESFAPQPAPADTSTVLQRAMGAASRGGGARRGAAAPPVSRAAQGGRGGRRRRARGPLSPSPPPHPPPRSRELHRRQHPPPASDEHWPTGSGSTSCSPPPPLRTDLQHSRAAPGREAAAGPWFQPYVPAPGGPATPQPLLTGPAGARSPAHGPPPPRPLPAHATDGRPCGPMVSARDCRFASGAFAQPGTLPAHVADRRACWPMVSAHGRSPGSAPPSLRAQPRLAPAPPVSQ